jgi:mannose-6-phosphate isomerase
MIDLLLKTFSGEAMTTQKLSEIPLLTDFNRVERFYSGGKLLDQWQGIGTGTDGYMPEEFLVSTTEYIGTGNPPEKGISRVFISPTEKKNLYTLINTAPNAFLGVFYARRCHGHAGVQLRAGDSTSRLIIQCHPKNGQARKFFNIPFGKTEAWYINDVREICGEKAHVYCGFKPGISRKEWQELFRDQDSQAMLDRLHRFDVESGDCFLIKAGTPHAIGGGCLFIELHQPCDITLRTERNFTPRPLTDEQMHYGAGFDALFDCFDYTGRTREETLAEVFMEPVQEAVLEGGIIYSMISYENTPDFSMKKIMLRGRLPLPPFEGHYLMTVAGGKAVLEYGEDVLEVSSGRGVFVPAGCRKLAAAGNAELVLAYPFKV